MRTHIQRQPARQKTTTDVPTVRATYTVEQVADVLGISRSHAYSCVRSGEIPSLRLRRRILIPATELQRLLDLAHRG